LGKKPILLIQTAFLGDLLLAIPLLKHIRLVWPEHPLFLVCRSGVGDLLLRLKLVDQVFEVQKGSAESYQKVQNQLATQNFEAILCPHQSLRSSLLVRALQSDLKIGFRSWWNFLIFDQRIVKNAGLPEALRQLSLLTNVSDEVKTNLTQYAKNHSIRNMSEIPAWAEMKLEDRILLVEAEGILFRHSVKRPFVCLFPGSVWPTKQWTKQGFIDVGNDFSQQGFQVLIMGGAGEEELGGQVAQAIPRSVNLVAQTKLHETLAILAGSQLVISNDSAGQHLAAVAGVPTVSIFGPTVLELGFRPWNNQARIVEKADLFCRPCGKHGHKKCPLGTHECMKSISSQQVLAQSKEIILPR
jgi:heptosyltransferase-2